MAVQLFFNNASATVAVPRGTTLSFFPTAEKQGTIGNARKMYKPAVLAALRSERVLNVVVEGVTFVTKMEVVEAMGDNLFTRKEENNTIILPDHIRAEMFPPIFDYMRNKLIRPATAVLRNAPMTPRQAKELDDLEEFIFGKTTKTLYQVRENESVVALLPPSVSSAGDPSICLDPNFVKLVVQRQDGNPSDNTVIADLNATYNVAITDGDLLLSTVVHVRRGRRFAVIARQEDIGFYVMHLIYDDADGGGVDDECTPFVVA